MKIAVIVSFGLNMPYWWHMRTTVELPDPLLEAAKRRAMESGVSLKDFFIAALEQKMANPPKTRLEPPSIEGPEQMTQLSREQIDEAMFG